LRTQVAHLALKIERILGGLRNDSQFAGVEGLVVALAQLRVAPARSMWIHEAAPALLAKAAVA
jgi:hypothetical protein